jgi:hypothetical protein
MWDDHHTTHTVTCLFSIMTNVECPELANFPKPEDTVLVDSKFQVPSSKVCDCSRITSCVHTTTHRDSDDDDEVSVWRCSSRNSVLGGRGHSSAVVWPRTRVQNSETPAPCAARMRCIHALSQCCTRDLLFVCVAQLNTRDDVAPRMPETRQRCPNSVSCCRSTTATTLHRMLVALARLV